MAINKAKTLANIQNKINEHQAEIEAQQNQISDLERLQWLVENDDERAYDHWDAQWRVVEDDDRQIIAEVVGIPDEHLILKAYKSDSEGE